MSIFLANSRLNVWRGIFQKSYKFKWVLRICTYSTSSSIRNIGILAHVDAGKTTVVERMLFYSGCTRRIGEVDKGSTIMDYLPMERQRGITIKAAAIWFLWNGNRINFIDTPGHADFVFEVERALSVIDGAVVLLDAIAGVEAQTVHVWERAVSFRLPRVVFVNKMDLLGADSTRVLLQLRHQLGARPVPMQIPIFDNGPGKNGSFCGIVDIITLESLIWPLTGNGSVFTRQPLDISVNNELLSQVVSARTLLVETLAETDEVLIDKFLVSDCNPMRLCSEMLQQSVRRATLSNYLVPVFYGSAFKNIGIQPLLDAMVAYLPTLKERQNILGRYISDKSDNRSTSVSTNNDNASNINGLFSTSPRSCITESYHTFVSDSVPEKTVSIIGDSSRSRFQEHIKFLCESHAYFEKTKVLAIVFKVIVEKTIKYVYVSVRQVLLRIGCLRKGQWLRVVRGGRIRVEQLLEGFGGTAISGKEYIVSSRSNSNVYKINTGPPISRIETGNWGIIISNDGICTGDIFVEDMDAKTDIISGHLKNLKIHDKSNMLTDTKLDIERFTVSRLPVPVVTVALEPFGASTAYTLSQALTWLLDEDPSLRVDDNDGQILLSGIGELHIAAACDRLRNHFCMDFQVGEVQFRCWEKILSEASVQRTYETNVQGKKISLNVSVRLEPINSHKKLKDDVDNEIVINESIMTAFSYLGAEKIKNACISGVLAGLQCGPIKGFPISGAKVVLESVDVYGAIATASILGEAVRFSVAYLISTFPKHSISILEPIMHVIITLPYEKDIGNVVKDLTGLRQGKLVSMEGNPSGQYILVARVLLRYMLGYSGILRGLTSGTGSFVMSLDHFGINY
ncbi:hypothetical protein PORY_000516 [Pneumocystis oryctolagi]|uniref:Uncharacterized protein n=1 Tax=Pneumocystis oryctolagi TaxID=42067 RepID=A0ACB7CH28_9ASCO|nr:hypothetical protein PORY_000516 [Pneumocystis oryctolagi]